MTDKQPMALLLADVLEDGSALGDDAAAELRRLHEAHDWQYKMAGDRLRRIEKLERVNAELVEALEYVIKGVPSTWVGVVKAQTILEKTKEDNNG